MDLKPTLVGLGMLWCASVASALVIQVPDGDVEALRAAIRQANEAPEELTTIELARNGHYVLSEVLPVIRGVAEFRGNSATLDGSGGALGAFGVSGGNPAIPGSRPRANAHISEIHVTGFRNENPFHGGSVVVGIGYADVLITDSTFTDNFWYSRVRLPGTVTPAVVLFNGDSANTVLRNVTISGNRGDVQFPQGIAIYNHGKIRIENSTIVNNSFADVGGGFGHVAIYTRGGGGTETETLLVNSVIANGEMQNCVNIVLNGSLNLVPTGSLGHNIDSDGSCELSGPGDLSGIDPLLRPLSDDPVPVHRLRSSSPAIDAGDNDHCTFVDALGTLRPRDGDGDDIATCDIGAVEAAGTGPFAAPTGQYNGMFFDPDSDGHYVTLQRLSNDRVLVIWNTFDVVGGQSWVFGVGSLIGSRIEVAEVYQSTGGVLQLNGPPQGQVVGLWGRFEVDIASCQDGRFRYESNMPGFGAGEFALSRLAFVDGLECED